MHPTLIPAGSPLAAVSGAFNAIFVTGDAAGDQMFYGRGAGQMPTASAVWSDAIEIARRVAHQHEALAEDFPLAGERRLRLRPMSDVRSAYYLRAMVQDRPGVLSQVAGILGRHEISIAIGHPEGPRRGAVPIVMMTHEAPRAEHGGRAGGDRPPRRGGRAHRHAARGGPGQRALRGARLNARGPLR